MASEQATRPYNSPLRDRRAAETRELVLYAVASIITDRGTTEFSMQEVADEADVSLRTVYRYFPNRQGLLDGLANLIDERLADLREDDDLGWQDLHDKTLDDLLEAVPVVFERLDDLVPLSSAMVLLSAGGQRRATRHDERTEVYRHLLTDHLARLEPDEAERVFAVIRHLLSSTTWFALREEFGLDGREAGVAATRTVAALLAAGGGAAR